MFRFQKTFHHVSWISVEMFNAGGWKPMRDYTWTYIGQVDTETCSKIKIATQEQCSCKVVTERISLKQLVILFGFV